MNTPDTEMESGAVEKILEHVYKRIEHDPLWENWLRQELNTLLTSRDTYWRERVRKEVEFARSNYDREGKHALDYVLSRLDNLK